MENTHNHQIEQLKAKEKLLVNAINTIDRLHPHTIISNYYKGNLLVFSDDGLRAEWFTPAQIDMINISILNNEILQPSQIRTKADGITGLKIRLNQLTITIEKLSTLSNLPHRVEYMKLHGLNYTG